MNSIRESRRCNVTQKGAHLAAPLFPHPYSRTVAILSTLVLPGVPKGTPAVITT